MTAPELAAASRWVRSVTAAEAETRIGDWYQRGFVLWSDRETQSTHLRNWRREPGAPREEAETC